MRGLLFGVLLASVLLAQSVVLADSSQFVRIENSPVVSDGGWSFGVSWIDFNGDTYPDLVISNQVFNSDTAMNIIYRNNGDGTYTRVLDDPISGSGSCLASTWADFDNDGDIDGYFAKPFKNANLFFVNQGDGKFIEDTSSTLVRAKKFSMEVAWVDYDNDGWLDMFVANHRRPTETAPALAELYHNLNGKFTLLNNPDVGLVEDESNGFAWGDYDNDGDRDLYWTRNDKLSLLYVNNGDGTFNPTSENVLVTLPSKYHANWADYDNDGDLDLYSETEYPGAPCLVENIGNGEFRIVTGQEICSDTGFWAGGYWGDYDNDGWLDLVILGHDHYKPKPNRLYHNNGDGTFARVVDGPVASEIAPSSAAAWSDHDRDGDLDLFIGNVGNTNNSLYENKGNTNHWLHVKLEGNRCNSSGIGATIRIKAKLEDKPIWQMREISAKNGFMSQSELPAHFGLGEAEHVDSLVIDWPGGNRQILTNVKADQYLTISETNSTKK